MSTCRCVMQANPDVPETWADLYRLLPCLRQSLSCYVCTKILSNPIGPTDNVCRHFVCEKCRGGKMKLKPSCSWCKDHSQFTENVLLKILVSSFRKLCEYIYTSTIGQNISAATVNGETNSLNTILQEAVAFEDPYIVKSSQPTVTSSEKTIIKAEPVQPVPGCSVNVDIEVTGQDCGSVNEIEMSEIIVKSKEQINHQTPDTEPEISEKDKSSESDSKPQKKMVIFLKRAAKNRRRKNKLKIPGKKSLLKTSKSNKISLSRLSNTEKSLDFSLDVSVSPESDLENEQSKRTKLDLPPPELKPPSFCRCGKSGKYNQLTCLGQRCPCYSMKLPCIGCKCKGCRNPKKGPSSSGQEHFSSTVLRSGVRNQNDSLYVM